MSSGPVDDAAVLNALFTDSPQGLYVFDAQRRVTRFNPSARGVRKLWPEDVLGHRVEEFAPGIEPHGLESLVVEAIATGQPVRRQLVRGPSPSDPQQTLTLEVSVFPLYARTAAFAGWWV